MPGCPPTRRRPRAGGDWQRETQPDKDAGPAWEPRAGAPTAHRPLPRAVLFVLPAAQSQPLHAHPASRPHRLCPQTYWQFDHLAPPWMPPHLCPVLLQSLLSARGAGSDHAWLVLHAAAGTTTPNTARWGPSPPATSLSPGCKASFLTWRYLSDLSLPPWASPGLAPTTGPLHLLRECSSPRHPWALFPNSSRALLRCLLRGRSPG